MNNPLKYVDPSGQAWIRKRNGETFWDPTVTTTAQARKKHGPGASIIDGQTAVVRETFPGSGFKVGHFYTYNADGSVTPHGPYSPPPPAPLSTQYGDEMAAAMGKLYLQAGFAALTGGASLGASALAASVIASDFLIEEDAPDPQTIAMAAKTKGPEFTAPTLPSNTIVEDGGVSINHNYRGTEHGPAHAHVRGGGPNTRIGPLGHPLQGDPPLSQQQRAVVERNRNQIRRTLNKVGRWLRYIQRMRGR